VRLRDDRNAGFGFIGFQGKDPNQFANLFDADKCALRLYPRKIRVIASQHFSAGVACTAGLGRGHVIEFLAFHRYFPGIERSVCMAAVAHHGQPECQRFFADTGNTGKKNRMR